MWQRPYPFFLDREPRKLKKSLQNSSQKLESFEWMWTQLEKKGAHKQLLDAFGQGKADILLGTQMIAKGLDFPKITLVGVLAADSMLHIPDFRSAERTFQLLEQVAGRAGRDELRGEVLVQSYTPEHYSIQLVKEHDYEQFVAKEMQSRKIGGYPPYYFMALLTISDTELASVMQTSQKK